MWVTRHLGASTASGRRHGRPDTRRRARCGFTWKCSTNRPEASGQEPLGPREADLPSQPSSVSETCARRGSASLSHLHKPLQGEGQKGQKGSKGEVHRPTRGSCWTLSLPPTLPASQRSGPAGSANGKGPRALRLLLMPQHAGTRFRPGRRGVARQNPAQAGPGRPAWWALSLWPPLAEGKRAENGRGAGAPVNYRVLCPPGLCPFLVMVPYWHRGPGSGRLRQGQGPGVALTQAPPFHPEVTVPHLPSGLLLEVNRADTCPSSPRTSRARPCLSRDPEPWAQRPTDPTPGFLSPPLPGWVPPSGAMGRPRPGETHLEDQTLCPAELFKVESVAVSTAVWAFCE